MYGAMPIVVLSIIIQIALIMHVIRTGRPNGWIFLILFAPGIGSAIYVLMEILPSTGIFPSFRKAEQKVIKALDPTRELRAAQEAFDLTPTVGNRLRLADASVEIGDFANAERLYKDCLEGQFIDDPTVLLGHARTLVELGRNQEALNRINQLRVLGREGPAEALVFARAAEALGQVEDAEEAYAFASPRIPTLEAHARYIRFLRHVGKDVDALRELQEFDVRLSRVPRHFQSGARKWRTFAVA
jgi:hypothetical protein